MFVSKVKETAARITLHLHKLVLFCGSFRDAGLIQIY